MRKLQNSTNDIPGCAKQKQRVVPNRWASRVPPAELDISSSPSAYEPIGSQENYKIPPSGIVDENAWALSLQQAVSTPSPPSSPHSSSASVEVKVEKIEES